MSHRSIAFACLLLLAGCRNVAPVDRINAAMPVSAELRKLQVQALADVHEANGDFNAMRRDIQLWMEERVEQCGRTGAALDPACFAKVDAAQRDWLQAQRLRPVLSAPPLRLMPSRIATIATPDGPGVAFASAAGVAITTQSRTFTAWNLLGGSIIAKRGSKERPGSVLSPNGRVYTTYRGRDCVLRRVDTGKALAVLHDVVGASFRFVGSVGGIARVKKGDGSTEVVFLDFIGGSRIELSRLGPSDGINVIAQDATHFQLTGKTLVQLELRTDAKRAALRKTRTAAIRTTWNTRLSSDGRSLLVPTQTGIELVDLANDLSVQRIDLSPLMPRSVTPTADPDLLVVRGTFPGEAVARAYMYSIRERTIARIESLDTSDQIEWLPQVHANVRIDGERIEQIDAFTTGTSQRSSAALQRDRVAQEKPAIQPRRHATLTDRQLREAQEIEKLNASQRAIAAKAPPPKPPASPSRNEDFSARRRRDFEERIRAGDYSPEEAAAALEWLENVERSERERR